MTPRIADLTNTLIAGTLLVFGCYAQAPGRLEFEAASLKQVPPFDGRPITMGCRGGPRTAGPGLYTCENLSLANLVNVAYGLGPNELVAPDWMNSALFNLTARLPKGTTWEELQAMLRNLLSDRLRITAHRETRQRAGYRLEVGKDGPKFREAAPPAEVPPDATNASEPRPFTFDRSGYPVFAPGESGTKMSGNRGRVYEPRMEISRLAGFLALSLHEPVVDATGLTGAYEVRLYWAVDVLQSLTDDAGGIGETGPSLVQAIQQQLGLRVVRSEKVPFEVLVVDHADKVPIPN